MLPSGVADVPTWEVIVPQLARGAAGEEVLALQEQLNAKRGAGLSLTTDFDGPTNTAVMALQRHLGLPANGMVDLATWRNLLWHLVRPDFSRPGLCNYNGGNLTADWGTASAIAMLEQTATLFHERTGGRIAVGDISFEHGGRIDLRDPPAWPGLRSCPGQDRWPPVPQPGRRLHQHQVRPVRYRGAVACHTRGLRHTLAADLLQRPGDDRGGPLAEVSESRQPHPRSLV